MTFHDDLNPDDITDAETYMWERYDEESDALRAEYEAEQEAEYLAEMQADFLAQMQAEAEQAHWEAEQAYADLYFSPVEQGMYDDDPSPYNGDYSEM